MERKDLDAKVRIETLKAAVDTVAQHHGQSVAGIFLEAADTVVSSAKIVVFGAALGARYVAGFARGLSRPNA